VLSFGLGVSADISGSDVSVGGVHLVRWLAQDVATIRFLRLSAKERKRGNGASGLTLKAIVARRFAARSTDDVLHENGQGQVSEMFVAKICAAVRHGPRYLAGCGHTGISLGLTFLALIVVSREMGLAECLGSWND